MSSLLYLSIWRPSPSPAHELCSDESQMSYTVRWSALPILKRVAQDVAENTAKGARKRTVTEDQTYAAHAFHHPEGVVGVIGSKIDYDQVAAQMILNKVLDKFLEGHDKKSWASGNKTFSAPTIDGQSPLAKYADPGQINKLASIQKDLDETLDTMRHAIQQTTMRGEKLDELVHKSENLSGASKMFYQQARKQNSCCILM